MCRDVLKTIIRNANNCFAKIKNRKCSFERKSQIVPHSFFEGENYIGKGTIVRNSTIGFKTIIGHNCQLDYAKVGRYCSIAQNFMVIVGNHPTNTIVSTHVDFYRPLKKRGTDEPLFEEISNVDKEKKYCVSIGNDVWIGANVSIMNGVKIGDGAIIGACSLVTRDVPPYSICVGVPARVIKYRFSNEEIKKLLKIEWWNKPIEWIKKNKALFSDIKGFLEAIDC